MLEIGSEKQGRLNLEFWKDIEGWDGIYQISDSGNLKSYKEAKEGRILSNINKKGDYLSVVLCHQSRERECTRIHRLVAKAFIPNPKGKSQVNHRDGNRQNNFAYNLEWVTPKENILDAIRRGVDFFSGMINYNKYIKTNPICQFLLSGEIVGEYRNAQEAAKRTGVCGRNILQVANKEEYKPGKTRKQAGGFVWQFSGGKL